MQDIIRTMIGANKVIGGGGEEVGVWPCLKGGSLCSEGEVFPVTAVECGC